MKLNSLKFAIAAMLTTAIIWVICSVLVYSFPQITMMYSGDMMHMDTQQMMWSLTLTGFTRGLIVWSVCVGISAWIFASIYNYLQS